MTELAGRALSEIATALPGATAVLRAHKLDFCCGGDATLAEAAAAGNVPLAPLEAELGALDAGAAPPAPAESPALIDHILARYHETHRRELPELLQLGETVARVHRDHPGRPPGLVALIREIAADMTGHMMREERVLFPLMRQGGHPLIAQPIGCMRLEHEALGDMLKRLAATTRDFAPPADACPTWRALYAGLDKLVGDLMEHIHLENNVLFPRFVTGVPIDESPRVGRRATRSGSPSG